MPRDLLRPVRCALSWAALLGAMLVLAILLRLAAWVIGGGA